MKNSLAVFTFLLLSIFTSFGQGKAMVGTNEVVKSGALNTSQFAVTTANVSLKAGGIQLSNLAPSLSNSVYSSVVITNAATLFIGDTNAIVYTGGGNAKLVVIQPGGGITPTFGPQFSSDGSVTNIPGLITNNNVGSETFYGGLILRGGLTMSPIAADKARLAAGTNAANILEFYSPGLGALLSAIDTNGNFTGGITLPPGGVTNNFMPQLRLGNGADTWLSSQLPKLVINRDVSLTNYAHGASDDSTITSAAGNFAYGSYDTRVRITGSDNVDHFAGFQSIPTLETNFTGAARAIVGFSSGGLLRGGTATNWIGYDVQNVTRTGGQFHNQYGLYVQQLFSATNNYGLVIAGTNNNFGIGITNPVYTMDVRTSMGGASGEPTFNLLANPISWLGTRTYSDTTNTGVEIASDIVGFPNGLARWSTAFAPAAGSGGAARRFQIQGLTSGGASYVTIPIMLNPNGDVILAGSTSGTNGGVSIGTAASAGPSNLLVAGTITAPNFVGAVNAASLTNTVPVGSLPAGVVTNNYVPAFVTLGSASMSNLFVGTIANVVQQRNGTNAQSFRVYNTYTDASNGEWFDVGWAANVATLKTTQNGSGTARNISLLAGANGFLKLGAGGGAVNQLSGGGDTLVLTGQGSSLTIGNSLFSGSVALGSSANPFLSLAVSGSVNSGTTGTFTNGAQAGKFYGLTNIPPVVTVNVDTSGSGTGATIALDPNSTDFSGRITLTTGTIVGGGLTLFTNTFGTAFANTNPFVRLQAENSGAAALSGLTMVYPTATTTKFTLSVGATGLASATTYIWNYQVTGK